PAGGTFNGALIFPPSVGLMTVQFEAAGLGAQSSGWTLVIEEPTLDHEDGQFAIELEATSFPLSSASPFDQFFVLIGRLPSGTYDFWFFKFVENGTIVKTP